MRVKITGCTYESWWYSKLIGKEFEVEGPAIPYFDMEDAFTLKNMDDARGIADVGPLTISLHILEKDCMEAEEHVPVSGISKLFHEKVMEVRGFIEGDKVYYNKHQKCQNGIIKTLRPDNQAFVVYQCADDWDNYRNYTGILTPLDDLKLGWYEESNVSP